MTPSDNLGKLLTKRVRASDGTTLILNYRTIDANDIRALVQSIRLKGDRKPSMSLLARRAMAVYLARMQTFQSRPDALACEVAELERMCTPIPTAAARSKKSA